MPGPVVGAAAGVAHDAGVSTLLADRPVIGIVHPGAMGAAIGSALKPVASAVIWAAAGRSYRTSKRAEIADLVGVPDVAALVARADVVISVVPGPAAREVAEQVVAARTGPLLYVDASAGSAEVVQEIGALLGPDSLVEAVLLGPPAYEAGRTEIWLAGAAAEAVAALFAGSPFAARVVGAEPGTARAASGRITR